MPSHVPCSVGDERLAIDRGGEQQRGQRRHQAAPHDEREDRHGRVALHLHVADCPAQRAGKREAERERLEVAADGESDQRELDAQWMAAVRPSSSFSIKIQVPKNGRSFGYRHSLRDS